MISGPRVLLAAAILIGSAACVLFIDLVTKAWAEAHLGPAITSLVPGLISTTLAHNTGASFGILARYPQAVTSLAVLTVLIVLVLWWTNGRQSPVASIGTGLIIGGALGNLRDRIFIGHVIDFLRFDFAPWWPVFNIADVATVVGAVLLALWLGWRPAAREGEAE